jgi:signal transduction histidine kinase
MLEVGKSIPKILSVQKNIREGILIFLSAILIVMLLSDLFFTRRTLYPLNLIINKLKNTSSPSLFDKSLVKTSTLDFARLDTALGELMKRIDAMLAMEKDITVNISHELLTPVSVLRSRLENMLIQDSFDNQAREKIEDSLRILYRLKTLVNSLLMISRIESRQYLREDSFSAEEILNEVIMELEPIATDKNISIERILSSQHIINKANRSLTFSMFYNVLNNAIQNTGSEGQIIITDELAGYRYQVSVSDNGKGMTDEQVRNIFQRSGKKTNNESGRNGIGLLITKSIADFHQIELKIVSSPGKGTNIIFIFPENS